MLPYCYLDPLGNFRRHLNEKEFVIKMILFPHFEYEMVWETVTL